MLLDLPLTLRAAGRAHADTAWARYAEFARWSDWSPQISDVRTDVSRIAPGVTGRVCGPLGFTVGFRIDAVDELARTWSWEVRLPAVRWGPARLQLWHEVTERGDGCATALRVRGPAPVVLAYAPLARLALGRLVRP